MGDRDVPMGLVYVVRELWALWVTVTPANTTPAISGGQGVGCRSEVGHRPAIAPRPRAIRSAVWAQESNICEEQCAQWMSRPRIRQERHNGPRCHIRNRRLLHVRTLALAGRPLHSREAGRGPQRARSGPVARLRDASPFFPAQKGPRGHGCG